MEILGGALGNITSIPTRHHADLQNLSNDDHTQYAMAGAGRGAKGIDYGLNADKPVVPVVGQMYFSVDQDVLYICRYAGTWYNYPSAIVSDSGAQGDLLYNNGGQWVSLTAGTSGYVLSTQGAGANPHWIQATSQGKYKTIVTSQDVATTGAITYAHGFGVVPKSLTVFATWTETTSQVAQCSGSYDGTTQGHASMLFVAAGAVSHSDSTNIIYMSESGGGIFNAVVSWDATNITLTFAKTGTPTGTAHIVIKTET